ncbi:hypothetical protein ACQPYK_24970 [Streptosporangium sp. CA-135522]
MTDSAPAQPWRRNAGIGRPAALACPFKTAVRARCTAAMFAP